MERKNKFKSKHSYFLSLAFEQAKNNLGSTKNNPSVGCIVEKDDSVISSGYTSFNGRPHAEYNALNKKLNFNNSNLYVTLEPCSHYGVTPPCTNLINKKKVKKVFFSIHDSDIRSKNKSKNILKSRNISVNSKILEKEGKDFYESYFLQHSDKLPLIDAKIAISKDYFTINKKKRWITNLHSRKRAHVIRSTYDCLISTSKSINYDNSILNCRIEGLEKKCPDLVIIDRNLKLKKNLRLFNNMKYRKILLVTCKNDSKKLSFFKSRGVKIIKVGQLNLFKDYENLFFKLKKKYSRILVEAGLNFTNFLIKNELIKNIYIFQSFYKLKNQGTNNSSPNIIKKIKLKNQISVNLFGDQIYKEKI